MPGDYVKKIDWKFTADYAKDIGQSDLTLAKPINNPSSNLVDIKLTPLRASSKIKDLTQINHKKNNSTIRMTLKSTIAPLEYEK